MAKVPEVHSTDAQQERWCIEHLDNTLSLFHVFSPSATEQDPGFVQFIPSYRNIDYTPLNILVILDVLQELDMPLRF
jgi:hypothetical protein